MSMKNSNDTIGNRTRDLPACSSVPQPTATRAVTNKYRKFLSLTMKNVHERNFLLTLKQLLGTENIFCSSSTMWNCFINDLSLFLNKPLSYESLQPYIQNLYLQVISLILNLIRGTKRYESVNGKPLEQPFLFQDHGLEFYEAV
jgi:hypothetical protein